MKLALALVLLASTASAGPAGGAPMKKMPCGFEGATVVEVKVVQLGSEPAGHVTKVFDADGWLAHDLDKAGKTGNERRGCVAPADVKQVRTALAKARWKVTTAHVHCMAVAQTATEYAVKGKVVWTEKMCSGKTLDKDSAAAIDAVNAMIAKLES
ncbi:MAG: hypothetical protein ABI467_09885 [Kofleriaceae bacterium]